LREKASNGLIRATACAGPALAAGGCTARGAPSFSLFGAFFPAWMLCAIVGIVAAIVTRVAIVATRSPVPYPLSVCAAVGVICGALLWLVWFGR